MKPVLQRRFRLSSIARKKRMGTPIKIGGGDSGFISRSIIHHRKKDSVQTHEVQTINEE